ncbi:MAG: hypothetical protein WC435_00560 [Candidatus Paceibacterota bacterium]
MFKVGDSVLLVLNDGLRAHHKNLYDEMERKGLEKIQGEVREVAEKKNSKTNEMTIWINFSDSLGGKKNEQYGLPPKLLTEVSSEKIVAAEITPALPSEF